MLSFVKWQYVFECWRFYNCEQFSFKAHILITTDWKFLIFAIYVGKTSFRCSVSIILNNFIVVWLYLSWKYVICIKFWTVAVVRYYGNWQWYCFCIVCHKPIKYGHLVGNNLYFTIILIFISIGVKSKSYKHSLITYWTVLVSIGKTLCLSRRTPYFRKCIWTIIIHRKNITIRQSTFVPRDRPIYSCIGSNFVLLFSYSTVGYVCTYDSSLVSDFNL